MAANTVVYTSTPVSGTPGMVTDGVTSTSTQCVTINTGTPYVVMDLGVNTSITSVTLWTTTAKATALNGFKIMAMDDWRTCYSALTYSPIRKCGTLKVTSAVTNITMTTTASTCYGRFVALQGLASPIVTFVLCEMQVFGSKTNSTSPVIYQSPVQRQCGVNNNPYLSLDLAIGKTSYGSSLAGPASDNAISFATDGLEQFNVQCYTTNGQRNYYVLDLGAQVNISFVRIQNTYWDSSSVLLYRPVISNSFIPCQVSQIANYPACNGVIVTTKPNDLWEFVTDGSCVGRYFILWSKNITASQWLKICEIEVYGSATAVGTSNNTPAMSSCSLATDGSNVALGATVISLNNYEAALITDGVLNPTSIDTMCYYTYSQDANYVVVNLGAPYLLTGIKVWNGQEYFGNAYTIDILVGTYLRYQYIATDIAQFQTVGSGLSITDAYTLVSFTTANNVVAQYIMIRKLNDYLDPLVICELEVFGTIVSTMQPANKRPSLPADQAIVQSPISNFPTAATLRHGATYGYFMQYSGVIFSIDPSVQGILWSPGQILPYMVACTYGSGHALVSGKSAYFDTLKTNFDPIFANNIYYWLSPSKGPNARIISSTQILTAQLGDIVRFDISTPLTTIQQQTLLTCLYNGTIGIDFSVTYWAELYYTLHRTTYDFLLRALRIDFSADYISDDTQQIPVSDSDYLNNDYAGMLTKLGYMAQNDAYLQANGLAIIQALANYPDYLMTPNVAAALYSIVQKYTNLIAFICPGTITTMQKGADEMRVIIFNAIINMQIMSRYNLKAPCVDLFPGDISPVIPSTIVTSTLQITAQNSMEIHSTGLYLLPGQNLTYTASNTQGVWTIAIGCHTDELFYSPQDESYIFNRYPVVHTLFFPVNSNGTVYSPFGGVVWIENADPTGSLTIQVSGVLKYPVYNIRDPNANNVWAQGINNPGLWTEVMGEYVVISVPSAWLRPFSADDLHRVMNTWDTIVGLQHALAGTSPNKNPRERVVIDLDIAYGYGHSGYPIMVTYPWFQSIFNYTVVSAPGCWGLAHELGHRRQQMYYTFTGTTEVTVNIFADFIWSYLWQVSFFSGQHEKFTTDTQASIITYFENGALFSDWQNNYAVAYGMYGQIGEHYGFGLYQQVLTNYTIENPSPVDDQAIIDLWVTILSQYAGNNLASLFDFWGIPISDGVRTSLAGLPCFLPQDPITTLVPDRLSAISAQYNDACDSTPFQTIQPVIPDPLIIGRANDITIS